MTRINCVPPSWLNKRHLTAENYELPRVIALVENHALKGLKIDPVASYRMGPGHVKFFYTRLMWVHDRISLLYCEMQRRNMNPKPQIMIDNLKRILLLPPEFLGDWEPSSKDIDANLARLMEKDPDHYDQYTKPSLSSSSWMPGFGVAA